MPKKVNYGTLNSLKELSAFYPYKMKEFEKKVE